MRGVNLTMERESVLMYRSTRNMLLEIRDENKDYYDLALNMFLDYAFDGIEPDLSKIPLVVKLFWQAAKPLIDANNKKYLNGLNGGRPRNNQDETKPKPKKNQSKTEAKGNDNENENANNNATETVTENEENTSSDSEEDRWIPYQDENGRWIVAGEES